MKINFQFSILNFQSIFNIKIFKQKIGHWLLVIDHFPRRNVGGFTLVELLVVIGIAALSMALLFPNFIGARSRARDSQRKRELRDIQKALELYKLDQDPPAYPTGGGLDVNMCGLCWSSGASCGGNIYMHKFPCDPASRFPTPYNYAAGTDVLQYTLTACLENVVDTDRDPVIEPTCAASSLSSFTVKEP